MAAEVEYHPSQGRIDRLEVENFKSYRGHQHIGPFKSFTAVIGPNGSGKSNLMDAISFVLGVKTTQLRGSLKELLYSDGGLTQSEQPRRGFVKVVYVLEEENPGGGPPLERELHFARVILPVSSDPDAAFRSEYRIDDRVVSWDAYSSKLGSLGILVKVRNFLVFQGDIEAVASKSPQGLTTLFEQISGSEPLRARFDELVATKSHAEEKVMLLYTKRKQVLAEVKAKKREKEDAEKHAKQLEQLRSFKADYAVWQLAVEGRGLAAAMEDQRAAEAALASLQSSTQDHDSKVDGLRRQAAGYKKEIALLEKKMKKLQQEREKKSPALQKVKEQLGQLARNIRAGDKAVADKEKQAEDKEHKIKELQKELKQAEKEEAALQREVERHYAANNQNNALDSQAMQQEYAQLKVKVGAQTTRQTSERKTLEAEQETDQEQLTQLQTQVEQLRTRAQQLRSQAEAAASRGQVARQDYEEAQRQLAEKQKARQRVQEERTRTNSQRQSLITRQGALEQELDGLKLDRMQTRREREIEEMTDRLKTRFEGGVYGKLISLARPIQARFQLALTVAMQRDLDSVVVNNETTAKQCVQVLRDEKKPQMNFLPLDFLKVKPVNERLRQMGGTAKLAIDLLDIPDRRVERAFQYALGDTVICENEDEARRLAFGPQRLKVVTTQGTLITKRGTMTGGSAPPEANRKGRWDEMEVNRLKTDLEGVLQRLAELPEPRALAEQEQALGAEIGSLRSKSKFGDAEAKEFDGKAAKLTADAERAEVEAGRKEPQLAEVRSRMEARAEKIQRLADAINTVTDRLMADFSLRAGVSSIREWEERHSTFEATVSERRRNINKKLMHTKIQLEYEQGQLGSLRSALEAAVADVAASTARQASLESELAAAQEGAATVEGEVRELAATMDELRGKVAGVEGQVSELQRAAADLGKRSAGLRRAAGVAAMAVEERAGCMLDILNTARVDQVKLPHKASGRAGARDADEDQEMEDAEEEGGADSETIDLDELVASMGAGGAEGSAGWPADGSEGAGGSASQTMALATAMSSLASRLDTARLTRPQLAAETEREQKRVAEELQKQIADLQAELDKASPNMRAVEQYGAIKEREKEQLAALQAAQAEAATATEEFNRIKARRHDLFSTAFKHISEQISAIYKDLTRSSTHPLGGQAYLHLENEEEPYAGGIKYTAIPPAKRFRDMEQLSGGEKTVAALALLFAIHSFRPSPFFVLDEVDAALDATNVARVAHYIRRRTRPVPPGEEEPPSGFQSIVISLKDIFYEKADSLVGVCRDLDQGCSKTFTFDLARFEEPLPDS